MSDKAAAYPILVGIDFSELGKVALEHAFEVADGTPAAEPHVVYVAGAFGPLVRLELGEDVKTVSLQEASQYLMRYVEQQVERYEQNRQPMFARTVTHLRVGAAAHEILKLARELGAELIIVGTHGRHGLRRLLVGSVAEELIRHADCPVLIARPRQQFEVGEADATIDSRVLSAR
jgi:nucleotide-binding universal stress UspA family protein